jgi:hypothetical protein
MPLKHLSLSSIRRLIGHSPSSASGRDRPRVRHRLRPVPESLESRLTMDGGIATYTWTALGDGVNWNDPDNWSHIGYTADLGLTGVPVAGSNIVFPPLYTLPTNSPTTIEFNSNYTSFPINILTVEGSYTFQGNPVTVDSGLIVTDTLGPLNNSTLLLSGLTMGPQSTIYVERGSILSLGDADDRTGLQFNLEGGVTMGGSGQLIIDTQSVDAPYIGFNLQTFEIAGGTVTIGASSKYTGSRFQVDSNSSFDIADDASVQIAALDGSGTVDLEGTGAAGDTTSLTIVEPAAQADQFTGLIDGVGQLISQGNGTLTTGAIDFGDGGSIQVLLGTLIADGAVSVGSLSVSNGATLGGVGPWYVSGPAVFQAGTTFDVTLNGTTPATQYTQLVDGASSTGINLGNSLLTGSVNYEYEAGDQFTIATGPLVQGTFANVFSGTVLLGNDVLFAVTYSSTSVTLTALQSETTTQLSSSAGTTNPGQPVTFTATVSTRTAPVTTGTVSFEQGSTVLATVPVTGAGTAAITTSALPLGSTSIIAVYNGATSILGSTSASVNQAVVPYTTATALSSSANPSRTGQPVTFLATVTADGMPVTTGTVGFSRGNTLLGTVALGPDGTASFTASSLPVGQGRIQAIYYGTADDYSSTSPALVQAVDKLATSTTLTLATETRPNGRVVYVLEASVIPEGVTGITAAGTVIFRRNGSVIGKARVDDGTAILSIGRKVPKRAKFVAAFQGSSRFKASTSPRLTE